MDWNIARAQESDRSATLWDPYYKAQAFRQFGGAALLCDVLQATARSAKTEYAGVLPNPDTARPGDPAYNHSYTIRWSSSKETKTGEPEWLWHVQSFLGFEKARTPSPVPSGPKDQVDLLVVDDGNAGLRDLFAAGEWPKSVPMPRDDGWIVLKWARPLFDKTNHLWQFLQLYSDRLIAAFTVNDLRLAEMQISRELSWEETAQDVLREIPDLEELRKCVAVVVSFYTAGAVVYWYRHGIHNHSLHYDPSGIEGSGSARTAAAWRVTRRAWWPQSFTRW